jgi:hypothetical protein
MDRTDQRPADPGRDALKAQLDALTSRVNMISKDYQRRTQDLQQSLERARTLAITRTLGGVLTVFLFACTFGTWLGFPAGGLPNTEVNAWGISGIRFSGLSGRIDLCLTLLIITVLLGILATATLGTAGCVAVAISGIALFAAEISLQLGIDSQIAQGNLFSQLPGSGLDGSTSFPAHLGSDYPFLYIVTVALIIWALGATVAVRRTRIPD